MGRGAGEEMKCNRAGVKPGSFSRGEDRNVSGLCEATPLRSALHRCK